MNFSNHPHPPRWAQRLLAWLHPAETLEEVEGDLDELYTYWYNRAGKLRRFYGICSMCCQFCRRLCADDNVNITIVTLQTCVFL